jgi:hypothetical protein
MARIIRNLKIDDVSSVDVGAGRGVKVVLLKRDAAGRPHRSPPDLNKEVDMSGSDKCPNCGAKLGGKIVADDGDDDSTEMGKHGLDVVSKASRMSVDSLLDDFRKVMPAASEAEILKRAADSPLMNELHKQERDARLRAQGAY